MASIIAKKIEHQLIISKLLSILQELAPDKQALEKANKFFREIIKDTSNEKEVELRLVGALYDGLAYGNWIWKE